ncbi:unnamed protein product, partial [Symbiodinium sp. KB8]
VDLSIAAGRAEVTTRAVVVITDKISFTRPDAPRTPDAATAAFGDARAKDPHTAHTNDAAGRSSATGTIDTAKNTNGCGNGPGRASGEAAPPSPPPTRLAGRNMAKAGAAAKAKTSSPRSHRLPPGVSWDDLWEKMVLLDHVPRRPSSALFHLQPRWWAVQVVFQLRPQPPEIARILQRLSK